jgi:hypothetical protein
MRITGMGLVRSRQTAKAAAVAVGRGAATAGTVFVDPWDADAVAIEVVLATDALPVLANMIARATDVATGHLVGLAGTLAIQAELPCRAANPTATGPGTALDVTRADLPIPVARETVSPVDELPLRAEAADLDRAVRQHRLGTTDVFRRTAQVSAGLDLRAALAGVGTDVGRVGAAGALAAGVTAGQPAAVRLCLGPPAKRDGDERSGQNR